MQTIVIKKSKHTSVQSQHKNLSIQFSLDGFSFCITTVKTQEFVLFTEYVFNKPAPTPAVLLDNISKIFIDDKDLQADFTEINVIHKNQLATVVPNEYFDENELKTYLDYTIKTLENDHIVFDAIEVIAAKNVYIPFVNINNYLFQNFGAFVFKHHSTVLIEKLLKYHENNTAKHFFVNVSNKDIDIIVIKNNALTLYNSFSFNTKEDFIYYILFVAEQLEMNPDEFALTFLGAITKDSELYDMAYKYVRYIEFISTTSTLFENSNDFSKHANYILVS